MTGEAHPTSYPLGGSCLLNQGMEHSSHLLLDNKHSCRKCAPPLRRYRAMGSPLHVYRMSEGGKHYLANDRMNTETAEKMTKCEKTQANTLHSNTSLTERTSRCLRLHTHAPIPPSLTRRGEKHLGSTERPTWRERLLQYRTPLL